MEAFCAGDKQAFESLLARHGTSVYSYLLQMLHDESTALEIFQLAFIRIFKRLDSCRNKGSFRKQIFMIAHNLSTDYLRRHGDATSSDVALSEASNLLPMKSPVLAVHHNIRPEKKQVNDSLRRCLYSLSPEERELILLREYSGLKFKEIAEIKDNPIKTVLAMMHRAVSKSRQFYKEVESN